MPVLTLAIAAAGVPLADAYREALVSERHASPARFAAPEDDRLERTKRLFAEVARALAPGSPPESLVERAKAAGFELLAGHDAGGELWILREPPSERAGAGFYALRPGGVPVCLQAPHVFFDQGTGELALAVFAELRARCLCTNTIHRRGLDVAHAERSQFRAASEGLLAAGQWPVVQLHGFNVDSQPAGVAAVVSEGTRRTTVSGRLQKALHLQDGRVLLYPRDTSELGGTTNAIGASARSAGATFLHIEMSRAVRERLTATPGPLVSALREVLSLSGQP